MPSIQDTIARVAAENGVDPAFALAVASRESSFDPSARSSKTIAGLFQMRGDLRDQYGIGNSKDPAVQTAGWARFINDTKGQMSADLGRNVTDSEAYLGHYFGPDRAARVIAGAQAGMSPQDVFTPRELAENPNLAKGSTVGALAQNITGDINRRMTRYAGNGDNPPGNGDDLSTYGQADDDEGAALQKNFDRNKAWTKQGATNFNTDLGDKEQQFRQWVKDNKVPFDPDAKGPNDYDMRGFYQALQSGDPKAKSAIDPNDQRMHYPDNWKTPYHETFSNESQWADPTTAPKWNDKDQLVAPDGKVLFDDRAKPPQDEGAGAPMSSAPQKGLDFAAFGQLGQGGSDPVQRTGSVPDFSAFAGPPPSSSSDQVAESAPAQQQDEAADASNEAPKINKRPGADIDHTQFKVAGLPAMPTGKAVKPDFASMGQVQQSAYVPTAPSDDQSGAAQTAFLTQQPQQPQPDQQQFTA